MSTDSHSVTQNVILRNGLRPGAPYTPYLDDPWADPPISFPLYGKPATFIEQKTELPSGRAAAALAEATGTSLPPGFNAAGPGTHQPSFPSPPATTDAFVTSRASSTQGQDGPFNPKMPPGWRPSPDSYYPKSAWGRNPQPRDPQKPEKSDGPLIEGVNSGDLNSLFEPPTSQDKPPYPYTTILRFAILGSPRKKLTLGEIYETMENRFPWFKNNTDKGWRNSVRHTLSLGKCFVKVNRPVTEPGKGAYWSFDPSQGEGKVRPRNRTKKGKKAVVEQNEEDESMDVEEEEESETASMQAAPESTDGTMTTVPSALQGTPPNATLSPISVPGSGQPPTPSMDGEASLIARGLDDLIEIRKAAAAAKRRAEDSMEGSSQHSTRESPGASASTPFARSPVLVSASASTSANIPISHFARLGGATAFQHGAMTSLHTSSVRGGTPSDGTSRDSPTPSDTTMSDGPGKSRPAPLNRQSRYVPYEYPGPPPAGGR